MSDKSKIAWTEATWNPVSGCSKVSDGCRFCYAERDWPRLAANSRSRYTGRVFTDVKCHEEVLDRPLRWKRPRKIFVNSMSDLFHPEVPDGFIDRVFATMGNVLCSMPECHIFQILTKRPERMSAYLNDPRTEHRVTMAMNAMGLGLPGENASPDWPLPNVWLGVSVENMRAADERIPILFETPAALRWVSIEPMIGPVSFRWRYGNGFKTDPATGKVHRNHLDGLRRIDWIVVGGESGPQARPVLREWIDSIVAECREADVPIFVKQLGAAYSDPVNGIAGSSLKIPEEAISLLKKRLKHRSGADMEEWPESLRIREWPESPSPEH